ncbi:MAG: hypothetical protein AABX16_05730, partial [Nanoarchaeota archaeon]
DPQSLNRYSYVLNNPYKYVDESGLFAVQIGVVISGGVGLGEGIIGSFGGGIAITYSEYYGLQIGGFTTRGGGIVAGGGKLSLDILSISPSAQSLRDLRGSNLAVTGSGTIPYTPITAGIKTNLYSPEDKLSNILNNLFSTESYSINFGVGGGYLAGGFVEGTDIYSIYSSRQSLSDSSQSLTPQTSYTSYLDQKDQENGKEKTNNKNTGGGCGVIMSCAKQSSKILLILLLFYSKINKNRRRKINEKILFKSIGSIWIGESYLHSFSASWPFGKIEIYKNKLILRIQYFPDFILENLFTKKEAIPGTYKKIPKKIVLYYDDIIGYQEKKIPLLWHLLGFGVRFIHKNKNYPPFIEMAFFGNKSQKIINFLIDNHKRELEGRIITTHNKNSVCIIIYTFFLLFITVFILSIFNLHPLWSIPIILIMGIIFRLIKKMIKNNW